MFGIGLGMFLQRMLIVSGIGILSEHLAALVA